MSTIAKLKRVFRKDSVGTLVASETDRTTHTGFTPGKGRTAEDIEDLYNNYGTAQLVSLFPDAAFFADFTSKSNPDWKLDPLKKEELRWGVVQAEKFGWSAGVLNGNAKGVLNETKLAAVGPRCHGLGVEVKDFDTMGIPSVLTYYYNETDASKTQEIPVTNFHLLRTKNRSGWKGISKLQPIFSIITIQQQIVEDYGVYCKNAGTSFLHANDPHATTDTQLTAFNTAIGNIRGKSKIVTGGSEIKLTPISLMGGSYDPTALLNKCDEMVARVLGIPKAMLTGDPSGHMASSRESAAAFYNRVKEFQSFYFPQILPILLKLGAPSDVQFIDPTEMTQLEKAQFIKMIDEALDRRNVGDEQALDFINKNLGTEFTVDVEKVNAKLEQMSQMASMAKDLNQPPEKQALQEEPQEKNVKKKGKTNGKTQQKDVPA